LISNPLGMCLLHTLGRTRTRTLHCTAPSGATVPTDAPLWHQNRHRPDHHRWSHGQEKKEKKMKMMMASATC